MSRLGDAMRARGLTVVTDSPVPGRPPSTGGFRPAGVLLHHTASAASDSNQVALVKRGRADLPGPLCHVYVRMDGSGVDIISEGRANHAGVGNNGQDGNVLFYGIEVGDPGTLPLIGRKYETMLRAAAALLDVLGGLDQNACSLHREWTNRKVDIRNDGGQVRADLAVILGGDMPLTQQDVEAIWKQPLTVVLEDGTPYTVPASDLAVWTNVLVNRTARGEYPWQVPGQAPGGGLSDADVERVAQRTADLLAERMKS